MINDLLRWWKSVARQAKSRLHNECIGLLPLCLLGGFPWPQFEIAGVKQRVTRREKAKLCRTKDVAGGQQHKIEIMHRSPFTKWQHMLGANPRQSGVHQTRGAIGKDDLIVGRNVVAVRV